MHELCYTNLIKLVTVLPRKIADRIVMKGLQHNVHLRTNLIVATAETISIYVCNTSALLIIEIPAAYKFISGVTENMPTNLTNKKCQKRSIRE